MDLKSPLVERNNFSRLCTIARIELHLLVFQCTLGFDDRCLSFCLCFCDPNWAVANKKKFKKKKINCSELDLLDVRELFTMTPVILFF